MKEVASKRDPVDYCLSMELASSSTSTILALKVRQFQREKRCGHFVFMQFSVLPSQIPIDSRIKVIFHYKRCFSLVKHVKGSQFTEVSSIFQDYLPCPFLLSCLTVQQTADAILQEIFPCLVACGLVENRYVWQARVQGGVGGH